MFRPLLRSPFAAAGLLCLPMIIAAACSSPHAAQGWWQGHGPVIPHDDFPADCKLCHEGGAWNRIRSDFEFDHELATGVPLEGAHAEAQCLRCHNDRGPVATFASQGCAGCHEDVHLAKLGRNCEDCHGEVDWNPQGLIEEHLQTRFPLVGAHAATACFRCHPASEVGVFSPTDTACESCHTDLAVTITSPDHAGSNWLTDCQRCHVATTWSSVGGFGHDDWPLTGAHAAANCTDCHTTGIFTSLATACYSCHDTDYASAADPDHDGLGLPTTCQNCHGTVAWTGGNMNHSVLTDTCVTCHLADYQGTTDPDHQAQSYSTSCDDCHGTNTWLGANFSHSGITTGCVDCHLSDYQGTTSPDHTASGFGTSCETCHGTNQWTGATWDHSFPITSGRHSSFDCIDCHTTNSPPTFECIECHEHRQSEANSEHEGVGGYSWNSAACFSCHPNGTE